MTPIFAYPLALFSLTGDNFSDTYLWHSVNSELRFLSEAVASTCAELLDHNPFQ